MSIACYNGITLKTVQNIANHPDLTHVIDLSYEGEIFTDTGESELFQIQEVTETIPRTTKIKIITCSFDHSDKPYKLWIDPPSGGQPINLMPDHTDVISWPTRFFHDVVGEQNNDNSHRGFKQYREVIESHGFQKLSSCMIHWPKTHRLELLRNIFERDYDLDHCELRFINNKSAWQNFMRGDIPNIEDIRSFCLDNATEIFSPYKYRSGFFKDPFYYSALFDLVPETHHYVSMFTQKTVMPIINMKPFCIFGNTNCNTRLQEMGFVLFPDVFDYTVEHDNYKVFSNREDIYDHYNKLLGNFWDLQRNPDYYQKLYKKFLPRLEHNLNRFVEIIFDDDLIPDVILENRGFITNKFIQRSRDIIRNDPYYKPYLTKQMA